MNLKIDGKTIFDIIIGMSDGLTVPFALAAELVGALTQGNVVLVGGLAELAADGISIGLGWLSGSVAAKRIPISLNSSGNSPLLAIGVGIEFHSTSDRQSGSGD